MQKSRLHPSLCLLLALTPALLAKEPVSNKPAPTAAPALAATPTLRFAAADYLHRWRDGNHHEFTPRDQTDLNRWTDMVTIVYVPNATTGEGLANFANACLETYKKNKAQVLTTRSVPATPEKPAEHFIAVLFARQQFVEAVFVRLKLIDNISTATIYTHRKYGEDVGKEMSAWLAANGDATEKTLMALDNIPSQKSLDAQLPPSATPAQKN